jgi:hypothetical protein
MGYLSESSRWRQRRQRRQRLTMTMIVLLVVAVGVGAYGYQQGWWLGEADAETPAHALPACPPATAKPLTEADVHVNVYNSTSRDGLASTVASALGKRSFVVESVANDPLHADVTGTALVRYGPKGTAAARLLGAQVPEATLHRDKRKDARVDLVLGDAFRRLAPVAATATATSTPSVTCTPAVTATSTETSPSASSTATG